MILEYIDHNVIVNFRPLGHGPVFAFMFSLFLQHRKFGQKVQGQTCLRWRAIGLLHWYGLYGFSSIKVGSHRIQLFRWNYVFDTIHNAVFNR